MDAAPDLTPEPPSLTRRRRTFLAPLWLLALGGVVILVGAFVYWNSATTTTFVLLRHAEKQPGSIDDAPLTPQGELRAVRLAQMFGDGESFGRPSAIYVTDTRRTQQTAAGVAQRLGISPVILGARSSPGELANRLLHENRGEVALVIGHSNTVPALVAELADVSDVPPIGEHEFDTLYVVTVPTIGRPSVLRLKY
jgi:broad specificity phosphatase PhoE